ncbi:hypothetical protein CBS101457_006680 [Exobasidium rhododendri]|nr:hypothetical protein CBS101457_006680 [Exobasidium rhododendri]
MARAASKKQAAQNAQMVKILTYGFLLTNSIHLLFVFGLFRKSSGSFGALIKYIITEAIAACLAIVLRGMAKQGDDLGQAGLTSYMFDVIYVTWFVHLTTALISAKFWYTYLSIPAYVFYFAYIKLIVPFALGGRDPLIGLWNMLSSKVNSSGGGAALSTAAAEQEPTISKRQAKLQKRMDKGDPRVQKQQR